VNPKIQRQTTPIANTEVIKEAILSIINAIFKVKMILNKPAQ
jgi:hypothetical protein